MNATSSVSAAKTRSPAQFQEALDRGLSRLHPFNRTLALDIILKIVEAAAAPNPASALHGLSVRFGRGRAVIRRRLATAHPGDRAIYREMIRLYDRGLENIRSVPVGSFQSLRTRRAAA